VYARLLKRPLDIVASLTLILILSWLFILIAVIYLVIGEWPILFCQERVGRGERIFQLYKFRSLSQTERFRWGSFLRFTSLDELPQLFHVLRGEMSLIGPRPLPVEYLPLFSEEQRKRHHVRPGITGWAQVNGRNSISWKEKFQYDLFYVQHISFMLDCKIAIRTMLLLLSFRKDVSLEEEKFSGKNDA
jgi:lipopolysaccharide/colanic/teichoic acid biosynthesis glycosyltransferase